MPAWTAAGGSGRYGPGMGRLRRGCFAGLRASAVAVSANQRQDILLAHATAASGAGNLREVDVMLGGDSLDHRGIAPVGPALPRRRLGGSGRRPAPAAAARPGPPTPGHPTRPR